MISILIPIYNGIEYINESVTSVLDQSYENWELIIGVNGHEANSSVSRALEYGDTIKRIQGNEVPILMAKKKSAKTSST